MKPRNPQWGHSGRLAAGSPSTTSEPPVFNHLMSDHGAPDHDPIGGILLEAQKKAPPASSVFTPAEMDERIERMAAKVEADLAKINSQSRPAFSRKAASKSKYSSDLIVVSCAGCGQTLLAGQSGKSDRGRRLWSPRLPPPVAMYAGKQDAAPNGRPYCAKCLDRPVKPVVLLRRA